MNTHTLVCVFVCVCMCTCVPNCFCASKRCSQMMSSLNMFPVGYGEQLLHWVASPPTSSNPGATNDSETREIGMFEIRILWSFRFFCPISGGAKAGLSLTVATEPSRAVKAPWAQVGLKHARST